MSDELDDFFRCTQYGDFWKFQVGVVKWNGPHTPEMSWKIFRTWSTQPDAKRFARARSSALKVPRFFRTCMRCGELNNIGHMHDDQTCQGCAERYLGIVH